MINQGKYDFDISALEVDEQVEDLAHIVKPFSLSKVNKIDGF